MLVGRIPQDFNQRMLRAFACRVDQLGIDPLQDAIVPRLLEINSFSLHRVTQDERGAPDLIAFREYRDTVFWWHIIAYNEILSFREIIEGLVLKIPDRSAILAITTDVATRNNSEPTIAYI